jgi:transposase-like protein
VIQHLGVYLNQILHLVILIHNYNFASSKFINIRKGTQVQFCVVHKYRNIWKVVRRSEKEEISSDLKGVFKVGDPRFTQEDGKKSLKSFLEKWSKYPSLKNKFPDNKLDFFFSYLNFPYQIQSMIYTTNWIERFNKSVRKTTKNRNSMPSPESTMRVKKYINK